MNQLKKLNIKISILFVAAALFSFSQFAFGQDVEKIKEHETTFYREFFENIFYEPFAQWLRFDKIEDSITFDKHEALDVNLFDEVPDSSFFVNRHSREPMSTEALKQGPAGSGLDPSGPWRVFKGKVEGVSPGFFIEDQKGVRYLLKFDPKENPEMTTSAEIISQKFFHAFGYNVAEYYLVTFDPKILTVDPNATYYNEDGFKTQLTSEALQDLLENIPKLKGGVIRASASKLLLNNKGYMDFKGRRKSDPEDLIPHEDRRSIRALRVFGSWLNHYDLREGNTLDTVEEVDGKPAVKHYLIDFGSTLGSAASHPKVPAAGYEHIVDWFETGKALPTLKVVEKPWEKRWDELNRDIAYPELGYFDNFEFDPGKWKTQLPYEVFTRLTSADAFWAAKIIMTFSNENIKSIVSTANYSDPKNEDILSQILIARRDIIGRYWFERTTPLDQIQLFELGDGKYEIRFEDLQVKHGFAKKEDTLYQYKLAADGKAVGGNQEFSDSSFTFEIPSANRITILIQAKYGTNAWSDPPLKIILAKTNSDSPLAIAEIDHGT